MDHEQHFTFCCLDHSDLNSHFKNLSTSNTSLTLCESSTLSSKHDSMCHRKICIGQKVITGREFRVFREFQMITVALLSSVSHLYQ